MACELGMSRKEFYHATPGEINQRYKAYADRTRREAETRINEFEYAAWLNGLHHAYAVGAALNGRKVKYPKEPLVMSKKQTTAELSEEEKAKAEQELLAMSFNARAANARLAEHRRQIQSGGA